MPKCGAADVRDISPACLQLIRHGPKLWSPKSTEGVRERVGHPGDVHEALQWLGAHSKDEGNLSKHRAHGWGSGAKLMERAQTAMTV